MKREAGPFFDLRLSDVDAAGPAPAGQFLGRFNPGALEREMEAAGILAALAARGYPKVHLHTDVVGAEHRLRIVGPRAQDPLVELRVSEITVVVADPVLRDAGADLLYALSVHWLALQDPGKSFAPDRPPLPGQRHPGLGFGRRFYGRLMTWAHEWGKDALLNFPEYYHNAVFYSSLFRFVSPTRQGRIEALRRDLGGLDVCEASAAVAEGRVVEEGEPGGTPFRWEPAEMISPVTASVTHALDSDAYKKAAAAARDAAKFRVTSR